MRAHQKHRPDTTHIRLDAISSTEWRVCNNTVDVGDYLSILGFIERRNGYFEVTTMSAPSERTVHPTLHEAREVFAFFLKQDIHTGNPVV